MTDERRSAAKPVRRQSAASTAKNTVNTSPPHHSVAFSKASTATALLSTMDASALATQRASTHSANNTGRGAVETGPLPLATHRHDSASDAVPRNKNDPERRILIPGASGRGSPKES